MTNEELKTSKNAMEVLSKASELSSKFTSFTGVSKILVIAGKLTASFSCVGAVFGLFEGLAQDQNHNEVLRCFEKLNDKVDRVRDDIKKLEQTIKWENTQLQYADAVGRIKEGMRRCIEIGNSKGKEEKERHQVRLKDLCANQNLTTALTTLLDGMTGGGYFQKSILEEFYSTTNGDREKISALASRLLQLVGGGMVIIATYETVVRGEKGAKEETERYDRQLKEACAKAQSFIEKCVAKFQDNMFTDLNTFLDKGGSNESLVVEVSNFMRDKYDWLENYCLVYNDLHGFDQHCITGYYVCSLHRNEKCGVVFFRTKDESPKFSDRLQDAAQVVCNYTTNRCGDARETQNKILAEIGRIGIGWTGCAVITRCPDLRSKSTFSTMTIRRHADYSDPLPIMIQLHIFETPMSSILLLK